MTKSNIKSVTFLFLTALIWGTSFVTQSMGNDYMQPFTFSAARNLLGFIVLLPVVVYKVKKSRTSACNNSSNSKIPLKITVIGGIFCGLALTAASLFQQYGVKYTTVGKAGFITALYIIITPIIGIFIGKKCPWTVWIGALAACIGMYFLCMTESFALSLGDALTLVCAIIFSIHILIVDHYAPQTDGVVLSCIQFFVCFVISLVLALIFDNPSFQQLIDGIIPILYAGIMSSGIGYTFQILGQRNFNPTAAALILSLESVISAISGYIAYELGLLSTNQSLTALQITGCAIVFAAVIFVQLPITKLKKGKSI